MVDEFGYPVATMLFVEDRGRWLVDSVLGFSSWEELWRAAPAGRHGQAVTEASRILGIEMLVLVDEPPGYRPVYGSLALIGGWDVVFVFYNPGAAERRFVVEELGIDLAVPPYETRWITVNAPAGEYRFVTFTGERPDPPAAPACEGLPYPENTMVFYPEAPLNDQWDCGRG